MHKAQRGQKLSVVRKVVTPLNFVTPPSFSVTLPSCDPESGFASNSRDAHFVRRRLTSLIGPECNTLTARFYLAEKRQSRPLGPFGSVLP